MEDLDDDDDDEIDAEEVKDGNDDDEDDVYFLAEKYNIKRFTGSGGLNNRETWAVFEERGLVKEVLVEMCRSRGSRCIPEHCAFVKLKQQPTYLHMSDVEKARWLWDFITWREPDEEKAKKVPVLRFPNELLGGSDNRGNWKWKKGGLIANRTTFKSSLEGNKLFKLHAGGKSGSKWKDKWKSFRANKPQNARGADHPKYYPKGVWLDLVARIFKKDHHLRSWNDPEKKRFHADDNWNISFEADPEFPDDRFRDTVVFHYNPCNDMEDDIFEKYHGVDDEDEDEDAIEEDVDDDDEDGLDE